MQENSSVLAIVPHYNTGQWLRQCVESLVNQSRKPDQIVVVDDCSDVPPLHIVQEFSGITLMKTRENGGPYRIHQAVIQQTTAEYIVFQDADDWAAPNRLERLLEEKIRYEANMIGSQVHLFHEFECQEPILRLPLDPRSVLVKNPLSHPVLYATTLLSRDFFLGLGGFSTALRFGADSEFIRRSIFGGTVRNLEEKLYFRRIHPNSLTHSRATGFGSSERLEIQKIVQTAALELAQQREKGSKLSLGPRFPGRPADLIHIAGPPLM